MVGFVSRRILASLRHLRFFSLEELNEVLTTKMKDLNNLPFQKLHGSRYQLFVQYDQPALGPLPSVDYEFALWSTTKVAKDYHVFVDGAFYSVPFTYRNRSVKIKLTRSLVSIFLEGKPIATHQRSMEPNSVHTQASHLSPAHAHSLLDPRDLLMDKATGIGPSTSQVIAHILPAKLFPGMEARAARATLDLARIYGTDELEDACRVALLIGSPTKESVSSILARGIRDTSLGHVSEKVMAPNHNNVRGPSYFAGATGRAK